MLMQQPTFVRRTTMALAFCSALLSGAPVEATPGAVTLGEVTGRNVQPAKLRMFTGIVRDEFNRLELPDKNDTGTLELSASLVYFRTEAREGTLRTSCVVSAVLRDRRGGALRAILKGHARGEDSPERMSIAERSVMKVAVASALGRVREAVR